MNNDDVIRVAAPVLGQAEENNLLEAFRSGWISSQGPFIPRFEEAFSRYCGADFGVAVSSGTTALHLALVILGIGRGHEVILPSIAHIAVANMITLTGAQPVLVDCERATWNMDPNQIEGKITKNTRAILPVHLYGHPADMDPIVEVARKHGLHVIEDGAEAHGALYKGRRTGVLGNIACFSFYANKIITTGEGGMLLTKDPVLADKARKLRDQAYEKERRFLHYELGFNYRMTNMQAAIGLAQMSAIDHFLQVHRRNAHLYSELLVDMPGLGLPGEATWAKSVYWMYPVLVEDSFGTDHNGLMDGLKRENIDSRPVFYPIHLQPLYRQLFNAESYPVSTELTRKGITLPCGNGLSEAQVRRVATVIRSIGKK